MRSEPNTHRTAASVVAFVAALGLSLALPSSALADRYDPQKAGHPLRVAAYILHPFGVLLDFMIFRPAHHLVMNPQMAYLFGHELTYEDLHPEERGDDPSH